MPAGLIASQVFARFDDTAGQERELRVPLPATPGLARVKEVVVTFAPEAAGRALDLTVTGVAFAPER